MRGVRVQATATRGGVRRVVMRSRVWSAMPYQGKSFSPIGPDETVWYWAGLRQVTTIYLSFSFWRPKAMFMHFRRV